MHDVLPYLLTIKGRPGLYQLVRVLRPGVVLVDHLGEASRPFALSRTQSFTLLDTVTLGGASGVAAPLGDVLAALYRQHGVTLPVEATAPLPALQALLGAAVPDCDAEGVPLGPLQKLVSWYGLLTDYLIQTQPAPTFQP